MAAMWSCQELATYVEGMRRSAHCERLAASPRCAEGIRSKPPSWMMRSRRGGPAVQRLPCGHRSHGASSKKKSQNLRWTAGSIGFALTERARSVLQSDSIAKYTQTRHNLFNQNAGSDLLAFQLLLLGSETFKRSGKAILHFIAGFSNRCGFVSAAHGLCRGRVRSVDRALRASGLNARTRHPLVNDRRWR